jgi:hypothetical protein
MAKRIRIGRSSGPVARVRHVKEGDAVMCKSLIKFLVVFNLAVTVVAFAAAQGAVEVAAGFVLAVWATTLITAAGLNLMGRNLIGKSAGC